MKNSKRILAIILSLVMCVALLAACAKDPAASNSPGNTASPSPSVSAPTASQGAAPQPSVTPTGEGTKYAEEITFVMGNTASGSLNPFSAASNATPSYHTFIMIFDRLLVSLGEGKYGPDLATEWKTDDYKTFTFKLREDVDFHNGEHFTADDVAYTVKTAIADGAGSSASSHWSQIETVNVLGPYEIEFVLKQANIDFYFTVTESMMGIVNEKAMKENPESGHQIGTGAYKVAEFISNDYIKLERNDNYWGELPLTKRFTYRFVPEPSSRTIMLQNGEIQFCMGIGAEDIPVFRAEPDNFTVYPLTYNDIQGLSFNFDDPITGDKNFRLAVMYAINKNEIATFASGITVGVEGGAVWGYQTEFRNNDIPGITQDVNKAKEYLAQSSYKGEEVVIAATVNTNIKAAQAMQQQLALAGIKSSVLELDTAGLNALISKENNTSQMVVYSVRGSLSASFARAAFYPGGAQNRSNYNNPEVARLLDEAGGTFDTEARKALYMQIQELVAEDLPITPIYWVVNPIVALSNVGGFALNSDHNRSDFRYMYMTVEG